MSNKDLLKTLIVELFNVNKKDVDIVFEYDEDDIDYCSFKIRVLNHALFAVDFGDDPFCCGILGIGETFLSSICNSIIISTLPEDKKNRLLVLIMNQLIESIEDYDDIKRGLLNWTHVSTNSIVKALISNQNIESYWKLVNNFYNPNSGNTVYQFTALINQ